MKHSDELIKRLESNFDVKKISYVNLTVALDLLMQYQNYVHTKKYIETDLHKLMLRVLKTSIDHLVKNQSVSHEQTIYALKYVNKLRSLNNGVEKKH